MINNIVKILDEKDDFLKSVNTKNFIGISQLACVVGDNSDFINKKTNTFHLFFIAALLPKSNQARLLCLNTLAYFDMDNISRFNFLQFEDVFNYCKEKIVLHTKKQILQKEGTDSENFLSVLPYTHDLWKLFYQTMAESLGLKTEEMESFIHNMSEKQKLNMTTITSIDESHFIIMTQHIFSRYGYIPSMFNFSVEIYNEPNQLDEKITPFWPKG